jgi:hypothetical protein
VRINTATGPSLHLPSTQITVLARLAMTAGQLAPIRPTDFFASRVFKGGFDSFEVGLTEDGRITDLALGRRNEQSDLSQRCRVI